MRGYVLELSCYLMINQLSLEKIYGFPSRCFKSSTTSLHGPFKIVRIKVIHEVTNFKSLEILLIQKDNKNP